MARAAVLAERLAPGLAPVRAVLLFLEDGKRRSGLALEASAGPQGHGLEEVGRCFPSQSRIRARIRDCPRDRE